MGGGASSVSGQGNGEGEHNPGGNVVEGSGGHGGLADVGGEQFKLRQNASQHGEGSNGESNSHEDRVRSEADFVGALDNSPEKESYSNAEDEREGYSGRRYAKRTSPISSEGRQVELKADHEKKEE